MKTSPSQPMPVRNGRRGRPLRLALLLGLLALALLGGLVGGALAAGEQFHRQAAPAGGGRLQASSLVLQAAVGQPVAGVLTQGSLRLCVGFVCGQQSRRFFLPVIQK